MRKSVKTLTEFQKLDKNSLEFLIGMMADLEARIVAQLTLIKDMRTLFVEANLRRMENEKIWLDDDEEA